MCVVCKQKGRRIQAGERCDNRMRNLLFTIVVLEIVTKAIYLFTLIIIITIAYVIREEVQNRI